MGTFVQDSFTDSDATNLSSHTGETGATWAKLTGYTGNCYINGNVLENEDGSDADAAYYASGAPASADYDVEAKYTWVSSQLCDWRICGRIDTSNGNYYSFYYRRGSNTYRLTKRVSGTTTTLASAAGSSPNSGSWLTLRLSLNGSALEGFEGASSVLSTTDSSITAAGKAGVAATSTGVSGPRIRWDDFLATEAGGDTAISPANASHGHSAGNVTLGQTHALSISAAVHTHAAQNVALSVSGALDIANGTHGHAADNLTLAQHSQIIIAAGLHGHAADMASLSQVHLLSVSPALHAHAASLAVLAAEGVLAPPPRRLQPEARLIVAADGRTRTMTAAKRNRSLTPER